MTAGIDDPAANPLKTPALLRRCRSFLIVAVICFLASLCCLRSVLVSANTSVPTTEAGSMTVPLFNVWTILWNCSVLTRPEGSYWDAPIFHPHTGTFAYSEPQPLTMLLTPLKMAGASPALLYNVYLVVSLTLNGCFAFLLMGSLRCHFLSSCAAAVGMTLLPMVHDQLDVVQLVPLWPALWTLRALLAVKQASSNPQSTRLTLVASSLQLGFAYAVTAAASLHHCLFLTVLLVFGLPVLFWKSAPGRLIGGATLALIVAGTLTIPWVVPMKRIVDQKHFVREQGLVSQLSAVPADLLRVAQRQLLPGTSLSGIRPWYLSPGLFRTLMALGLIPLLFLNPRGWLTSRRRPAVFFLFLMLIAATFSLGTNLQVNGLSLWQLLTRVVPGMSQVRSAFRFGYFYQAAVIVLGVLTLDCLFCWVRVLIRSVGLQTLFCAIPAIVLAVEVLPLLPRNVSVPAAVSPPVWAEVVDKNLSTGQGVLVLPYAPGAGVQDFESTTRLMVSLSEASFPTVNGYSGFFPDSHFAWHALLTRAPDEAAIVEFMKKEKVEIVVCLDGAYERLFRSDKDPVLLTPLMNDPQNGIVILKLRQQEK